ncbi:MAG: hypothetical protein EXR98_02385 [Gemmataceae bacterium]|nr:hypothetical protein [Gemmataceae bacterium]
MNSLSAVLLVSWSSPRMLEYPTLLVHGWARAAQVDGSLAWTRVITDSAGQPLGFGRFVGDPRGSWFSWLRQLGVEVHEAQDASDLMTLTRSWGIFRGWDVHDAEGRHVGSLNGKVVVTGENELIGYLDLQERRMVGPSNRCVANFAVKEDTRLELTFTEELPPNPFLRMLLLGCILTLDPNPPCT